MSSDPISNLHACVAQNYDCTSVLRGALEQAASEQEGTELISQLDAYETTHVSEAPSQAPGTFYTQVLANIAEHGGFNDQRLATQLEVKLDDAAQRNFNAHLNAATSTVKHESATSATHTVKQGQSLWSIAQKAYAGKLQNAGLAWRLIASDPRNQKYVGHDGHTLYWKTPRGKPVELVIPEFDGAKLRQLQRQAHVELVATRNAKEVAASPPQRRQAPAAATAIADAGEQTVSVARPDAAETAVAFAAAKPASPRLPDSVVPPPLKDQKLISAAERRVRLLESDVGVQPPEVIRLSAALQTTDRLLESDAQRK